MQFFSIIINHEKLYLGGSNSPKHLTYHIYSIFKGDNY